MTKHPINRIDVREPVTVQNLTLFPLYLSQTGGPEYISSSEALEDHGMVVKEVSDDGAVPNLLVENPSSHCVLLLDGEELRGAKQNRIVNTTLLLAARSRTVIPVSCTESGRWSYDSPTFSHSKTVMPAKARRKKTRSVSASLASMANYTSDQGEVWNEVDELHAKVGSYSATSAMSDAYEQMRADLESAIGKIPVQEGQFGLLAMINNKPVGLDLISRKQVYQVLHSQLVKSYAMEAIAARRDPQASSAPGKTDKPDPDQNALLAAKAFLERCAAIKGDPFDSVALGTDWRFVSDSIVGSGLEVDDAWVHMAYFVDEAESHRQSSRLPGTIARPSRRSRFRRE
ncbi:hypothetical protein G0Q06_03090 [Puniceicoccales bacterium CK1056]|uniref:ARG and Rhodanese-Phosphatase-superfamily-associated domain-containing protein n=1 Tax=Oceanipulchritudo coccoides TaxID=2706888 RepID=A0A6B2LXS9_9BACT|nr:DUF6569 family protein [Oceanipulchritudo coccoides]NDV61428.1 hypothetical protein [Oceanipulchritudo coccoides]